jgi:hypothetical protein
MSSSLGQNPYPLPSPPFIPSSSISYGSPPSNQKRGIKRSSDEISFFESYMLELRGIKQNIDELDEQIDTLKKKQEKEIDDYNSLVNLLNNSKSKTNVNFLIPGLRTPEQGFIENVQKAIKQYNVTIESQKSPGDILVKTLFQAIQKYESDSA